MQLYFIRHGQSFNNIIWEATGSSNGRIEDPDLTPMGEKQARALGTYLKENQDLSILGNGRNSNNPLFTHIYSSLMVRAVQTGTIIAESLDLRLTSWQDIHEEGGIYLDDPDTGKPVGLPGKNREYFNRHFPNFILQDHINGNGWWNRPHESKSDALQRAERVYKQLLFLHGNTSDRVAFISHGNFYNFFLQSVLNCSELEKTWFTIHNTAITRIDFENSYINIAYMNRTSHLSFGLLT